MKKTILATLTVMFSFYAYGQEALKSTEEEYYDFLSLQGITIRPALNYRTLSDSEWEFADTESSDGTDWREDAKGGYFF